MKEGSAFDRQPTLLVGLGGWGSRFTDNIYGRIKENPEFSAFSIDAPGGEEWKYIPEGHRISLGQDMTPQDYLCAVPEAREWFPDSPALRQCCIQSGLGIRPLMRMAYELSLEQGRFSPLMEELHRLAQICLQKNSPLRIAVLATLVGGTASGIFIQVALMLRSYLQRFFPELDVKIYGEFVLPTTFMGLLGSRNNVREQMENQAYAALKELNAVNAHYFRDGKPVNLRYDIDRKDEKLLPYDYCFLYDRADFSSDKRDEYVQDAIFTQLFSESANGLYTAVTELLPIDTGENIYGTIYTEKQPVGTDAMKFNVFRSAINNVSSAFEKRIFFIRTPEHMWFSNNLFPSNTVIVKEIDTSATEISVTELCVGIRLSEMEKLKWNKGQYHLSYLQEKNYVGFGAGRMHLDRRWVWEMADIGEEVPEEELITLNRREKTKGFVFISYSTRDNTVAQQVRQVLEKNGIRCWMAPESIPAGSDYGQEIPKAIDGCAVFLLLLSDASQKSNWVPKELGLAIGKGRKVIPFQIDDAEITDAFNFYLTNSQRISAYNRMTEAYAELIRQLIKALTEESH